MVSSRDILDGAGLKSAKTLTRWYQQQLIPKPQIGTHPNGRGKMAFWPDWVLERCVRIRQLVQSGFSLDEIKATLGTDWRNVERRWRAKYRFRDASRQIDFDAAVANFRDIAWKKLATLLDPKQRRNSPALSKADKLLASRDTAHELLELVRQGVNAVLVFDGETLKITADFVVGQLFSTTPGGRSPIIVLPVFDIARQAFHSVVPGLPESPSIAPVQRIQKRVANRTREYSFKSFGVASFQIAHSSRD